MKTEIFNLENLSFKDIKEIKFNKLTDEWEAIYINGNIHFWYQNSLDDDFLNIIDILQIKKIKTKQETILIKNNNNYKPFDASDYEDPWSADYFDHCEEQYLNTTEEHYLLITILK